MKTKNLYHYYGRNGFITSEIFLEGAKYDNMYRLVADSGKMLTDGTHILKTVDIYPDDLDNWKEIPKEEGQI